MTIIGSATAPALAIAAGLHLAALPDHAGQGLVTAAFFAATAAVQLAGAVSLVGLGRTRWLRVAIVASNVAVLGVWFASRTVGLPIGPHRGSEPVGILDGLSVLAEVVVVVAVVVAGSATVAGARRTWSRAVGPALVGALGLSVAALGIGLAPATQAHDHPTCDAGECHHGEEDPHGGHP